MPLRAAIAEAMARRELAEVDIETDTEVVYQLAMGWMHGRLITPVPPTRQEAQRVVEFAIRGLERRKGSRVVHETPASRIDDFDVQETAGSR